MRHLRRASIVVIAAASAVVAITAFAGAAGVVIGSSRLTTRTAGVTVPKSTPVLTQTASAGGMSSLTNLTDQVTMTSGTSNATGTLTFRLHSDAACSTQFGSASVVSVAGAVGATYTSGSLTPLLTGTYYWTVAYSGDANNTAVTTACGAANSSATITTGPIGYTSIGSPTSATSNSTSAVAYPTGTATNDLLFLVEVNSFGGASTTPTGWTQLVNQSTNTPSKITFRVWTRLSGGETSVSLAFKSGAAGSTAWVVRYTRSSGYPPNPTAATSTVRSGVSGATATLTPATDLTTNQTYATVISFAVVRAANALTMSTPRSFVARTATTNTPVGGNGVALAVADQLVPAIGTPASPTWSQSGTAAQWAWATVAWN